MRPIIKCKQCGEYKEHRARGLCNVCYHKQWKKENPDRRKEYYQENKEKIKKYYKQYREKHKEKRAEYDKQWRKENSEYNKQYRQEHKEKRIEYNKQWWKNNLDKAREYRHKRRANGGIKKGTISKIINENIFKYGIITCEKCKEPCEKNHIDHIVPISRGGNNEYNNLQVLCIHCNREKHTRIADYRNESKQLFLGKDK